MREIFLVAVFGAFGSVGRYAVSGWLGSVLSDKWPFGTLMVNVLGSLLIGFIMQAGLTSGIVPQALRVPIVIGFLGAFTTFSSFSYETIRLFTEGNVSAAIINVVANLFLCLFATAMGFLIAKAVLGAA